MSSTVQAENNFLVPNATILVEIVLFLVLLGILSKWVLPPIAKAVAQRQEAVRASLANAEEAAERLASAEADYQQALSDARHEAARIREEAREQGAAVIAEARQQAQTEAKAIFDEARRRIEADRQAAFEQLRSEVGTLATELAGRIIGEPVADDAARDQLVERFLADIDRETAGADAREASRVKAD
jgi:F-type H+-transporting ATPase subunit b